MPRPTDKIFALLSDSPENRAAYLAIIDSVIGVFVFIDGSLA